MEDFKEIPKYLMDAGLTHTSPSANEKPNCLRVFEYLHLGAERRNIPVGVPAIAGTAVHDALQGHLVDGLDLSDATDIAQDMITQHKPISDLDELKRDQYIHDAELMIRNGVECFDKMGLFGDKSLVSEQAIAVESEHLDIPIIGYADLATDKYVLEIKTKWNRLGPPRKNGSRGFGKLKAPTSPDPAHLRQVAVYCKATGKPPRLVYITTEDYAVFDSSNCSLMSEQNLEAYYQQILHSAVVWQNLLKISTDPKVLRLYIKPDWDNFRWRFMPEEYLKLARELYQL